MALISMNLYKVWVLNKTISSKISSKSCLAHLKLIKATTIGRSPTTLIEPGLIRTQASKGSTAEVEKKLESRLEEESMFSQDKLGTLPELPILIIGHANV